MAIILITLISSLCFELSSWLVFGSLLFDVDAKKVDPKDYSYGRFVNSKNILFHKEYVWSICKIAFPAILSKYYIMDVGRIPRWTKLSKELDIKFKV